MQCLVLQGVFVGWFARQTLSWPRQKEGPEGQVALAYRGTNESLLEAGLGICCFLCTCVCVCVLFGVVLLYIRITFFVCFLGSLLLYE